MKSAMRAKMAAAAVAVVSLIGCGTMPGSTDTTDGGVLNVAVRIRDDGSSLAKSAATTWDTLRIRITGSDMDTISMFRAITSSDFIVDESIGGIPAGANRVVQAWTQAASGDTVHGMASATVDFEPNQQVRVALTLAPVCGSIYVSLSDFPSVVKIVRAGFVTVAGRMWSDSVGVTSTINRKYLALDYIPYGSVGTLSIVGLDSTRDTVSSWAQQLTFQKDDVTLQASFAKAAGVAGLVVTPVEPGVTLVQGTMNTKTSMVEPTTAPLVISEIMYAANDSEYIELHNPGSDSVFFDTLIVQIDGGASRRFGSVGVAGHGFYVLGRSMFAGVNATHSTKAALDLTSTGNWIALRSKTGVLMDFVAFQGGTNDQQWPSVSGKRSIVLDNPTADPTLNNYGKSWHAAQSAIAGTGMFGTPGTPGL